MSVFIQLREQCTEVEMLESGKREGTRQESQLQLKTLAFGLT